MAALNSIVVGTDGSETASGAVAQAIALATALGAALHVVSAYEPAPEHQIGNPRLRAPADPRWSVNLHEDVVALLERVTAQARAAGVSEVHSHPRVGAAADAILDVAEELGSDLIVVGNRGMTGATRFLLGSVPNKVSHHAPCSVLIVRTQ